LIVKLHRDTLRDCLEELIKIGYNLFEYNLILSFVVEIVCT